MAAMVTTMQRLLAARRRPGSSRYGLLAALIAVVAVVSVGSVGNAIYTVFWSQIGQAV